MLSKNDNKEIIEKVVNACIAVGTQALHAHHVLHGFDPVILKKADLLTSYAKILWDHHDINDLDGYVPDIAVRKISKVQKLFRSGNFFDKMVEKFAGKNDEKEVFQKEVDEINHDYSVAIDAIEKISTGHAEKVNIKEIDLIASHADKDEIHVNKNETIIESVNKDLHNCLIAEIKLKEQEHIARVNSLRI